MGKNYTISFRKVKKTKEEVCYRIIEDLIYFYTKNSVDVTDLLLFLVNRFELLYKDKGILRSLEKMIDEKQDSKSLMSKLKKSGLGNVALKNILNDTLQDFLAPISQR